MKPTAISFDEALTALNDNVRPMGRVRRASLEESLGHALAEALFATEPIPRFTNSAVDGFAVGREEDAKEGALLAWDRAIAAGDSPGGAIPPGKAVRIFTGAPCPPNTWAIGMQEDASLDAEFCGLNSNLKEGENIRLAGADVKPGDWLLDQGAEATPGVIAMLGAQNCAEVRIFERPRVGMVTIGDELRPPGKTLDPYRIPDSSAAMLHALVEQVGAKSIAHSRLQDGAQGLAFALETLVRDQDFVVVAGGASVGDHDCVGDVLKQLGEVFFHGVDIRPGKPTLFGQVGNALVLGLPGNPASSFACFHLFGRFIARKLAGHRNCELPWIWTRHGAAHGASSRESFERCTLESKGVESISLPIGEQASFGIRSLALSQCLVRIPREGAVAGTYLPTLLL